MDRDAIPSLGEACDRLASLLSARGLLLAVAESCTGGLLAASLTAIPGSSRWFEYGFVTYSARAKRTVLGVPARDVDEEHIVSVETALAMARGARALSGADVALGITGIAGPTGGTPLKPVGTVAIAWVGALHAASQCYHFGGNREAVRTQAVLSAVTGLLILLDRGFPARP